MVELQRLETGPCRLFAKLEYMNPGGSTKDRIALAMIEGAEHEGRLGPGGVIVEATSGNTGVGLALVAALKGYRLIIVIPDKMSQEKIQHLRAAGAEVLVTRSDVPPGHAQNYQEMARRIAAETKGAIYINQHANSDNPSAHERTTGPEIWSDMAGDLDAVVVGVGTGGSLTGLGRFLRRMQPEIEIVLADPVGSILADYVESRRLVEPGAWLVEGIGEDDLPPIGDLDLVDKVYRIPDRESLLTARDLLRKEGIFGGSSTGTLLAAALRYCREQTTPKRVAVTVPDRGDKYLSKMYNDYWMHDQGFLPRPEEGNLCDLIARPHGAGDDITVAPGDPLLIAYGRMKLFNVSQLPVLDGGKVVGVIDESDLLHAVYGREDRFARPVKSAMADNVSTLPCAAPMAELIDTLRQGYVALIVQGGVYRGLVTRVDLLNHLRRKAG